MFRNRFIEVDFWTSLGLESGLEFEFGAQVRVGVGVGVGGGYFLRLHIPFSTVGVTS